MRRILIFILAVLIVCSCEGSSFAAPAKKGKKKKPETKKEIKYTGFSAKRDPFSLPTKIVKLLEHPEKIAEAELGADITLPKVDIQGIIWSKRFPQVIINGSVMSPGDFLEEFEIKEIRRNGIILFFKGNDYFFKVPGYTSPKKKR